jgi:hypothetical protein
VKISRSAESDDSTAMMITARKVEDTTTHVRYEYGLADQFDRVLTIDRATGQLVDPPLGDRVIGKIYVKIKREWEATGEFPNGALFAS